MKRTLLLLLAALPLAGCLPFQERVVIPAVMPVSRDEVLSMTESGYTDGAILEKIGANGVIAGPTADDIVALQRAGVSPEVMEALLKAPVRKPEPAREEYHTYYPSSGYSPAFMLGAGAAAGYIFGRSRSYGYHGHTHGAYCGCR